MTSSISSLGTKIREELHFHATRYTLSLSYKVKAARGAGEGLVGVKICILALLGVLKTTMTGDHRGKYCATFQGITPIKQDSTILHTKPSNERFIIQLLRVTNYLA